MSVHPVLSRARCLPLPDGVARLVLVALLGAGPVLAAGCAATGGPATPVKVSTSGLLDASLPVGDLLRGDALDAAFTQDGFTADVYLDVAAAVLVLVAVGQ
ncbi:hypothetical protein [Oerskovia sp. KBS0722]|uniref:hypothetical protein n=1 Tax=Oerskovia sp. KBS0722 TaxID=1179673 RepID=UPI00110D46FA|nr:hypothetical protein [Oerskovia sp. KBS0722]QDW64196.1 hypothetical protein FFI11_018305 [Oerskovia sp. KBS0722]